MINDMIAVGDCDSDYNDFDIIVNLFMETNNTTMGEIKETTENNKTIFNIGLLDHPGLENTMLDILNHMIPKLITYDNKKILFHCFAGVSRSATVAIAYIMKKYNLTVIEAYNMVKNKRNIIHPNEGFMLALTKFSKV
jgi:protein-tyrosine phosphatase